VTKSGPLARVLLVDDHEVFRVGVRNLLSAYSRIVGEAREGGEAVRKALQHRPDVVVMDVVLPGMNGIAAIRQIKERLPGTNVVVLTAYDTDKNIAEAIKNGACAFVPKYDEPQTIVDAVENAAQGLAFLPPGAAERVVRTAAELMRGERQAQPSARLSDREIVVLQLMAQGRTNGEIADQLFLSPRTVGNHIAHIYRKLGVDGRAAAIVYAVKQGLVEV
jgi:DNA-binding NarL/FixJ family response regulator